MLHLNLIEFTISPKLYLCMLLYFLITGASSDSERGGGWLFYSADPPSAPSPEADVANEYNQPHQEVLQNYQDHGQGYGSQQVAVGGLPGVYNVQQGGGVPNYNPNQHQGGAPQYNLNQQQGGGAPQYNPNQHQGGGAPQYNPNQHQGGGAPQYNPNAQQGGGGFNQQNPHEMVVVDSLQQQQQQQKQPSFQFNGLTYDDFAEQDYQKQLALDKKLNDMGISKGNENFHYVAEAGNKPLRQQDLPQGPPLHMQNQQPNKQWYDNTLQKRPADFYKDKIQYDPKSDILRETYGYKAPVNVHHQAQQQQQGGRLESGNGRHLNIYKDPPEKIGVIKHDDDDYENRGSCLHCRRKINLAKPLFVMFSVILIEMLIL